MMKQRIVWTTLLLVFALASEASQFAQSTSTGVREPDMGRRALRSLDPLYVIVGDCCVFSRPDQHFV